MGELLKQKIKNINQVKLSIVMELIIWFSFVCAVMVKCFYFQFSSRVSTKPYFTPGNTRMLLTTLTSILIIIVFTLIITNRKRHIFLLVINIILSLLVLSDTLYYRYYYNTLSVPVLYQIGLAGSIKDSILNLLRPKDIVFFVDLPFIMIFMLLCKKILKLEPVKIHIYKKLTTAACLFAVSFGVFQWTYAQAVPGAFPFDNNYVSSKMGILYFHYYDIKKFAIDHLFTDNTISDEEVAVIDEYFGSRQPEDVKYKGVAKGKNLIVVQMEAFMQFMINQKLDGKEITPNLNKFINDSAYFENFYYQTGNGNTSDAEFLTNTSLYPLRQGAVYFRYTANTYESTANLLKEQGYSTYVAHANAPSFWNRTEMYKSLGFDNFFNSTNLMIDEYLGWGLSDKSFLRQSLDKIDTSRPFYGFFITLSSHHPFNYFDKYDGFDPGKYKDSFLGDYIKAVSYVDEAIGEFLEDLKKRGLYDNSVIVLYGDHGAFQKDQINILKEFLGFEQNDTTWVKLQKTPCFIRFPGMDNPGVKSITAGQIDILPTVANLLGFDAPHAIGKDLFNTEKGYAVIRSLASVVTDDFVYIGNDNGALYNHSGERLENAEYEAEVEKYRKQLELSDLIIAKDGLSK